MKTLLAACEGILDEAVLVRLAREATLDLSWVDNAGGKVALDARLASYAGVGRKMQFLALRDLDRDADCAPALVKRLVPRSSPGFRLHLAVRSVEAWLLADAQGLAASLGVPVGRLPLLPDELDDPRGEILALARRSKRTRLALELLPSTPGARVGPGYTAHFVRFVSGDWSPDRARLRSRSLESLLLYLERLA